MSVSVVITTRDRAAFLRRCVASVLASTVVPEEVVIVDDASVDETRQLTDADFESGRVRIVHAPEPVLLARARNWGARLAHGDLVLFIDDDNIIAPTMIERLLLAAAAEPRFGILAPSVFIRDSGERCFNFQAMNFYTGWSRAHAGPPEMDIYPSQSVSNVFMVRKTLIGAIGLFDERFLQSYTELEYAVRARRTGTKIGVVTAAHTFHDVPQFRGKLSSRPFGGVFPQKAYCLIRNRALVIFMYGTKFQRFLYLIAFSWVWPALYSALVFVYGRRDLVPLYWRGWKDSLYFFFSGRLPEPPSFAAVPLVPRGKPERPSSRQYRRWLPTLFFFGLASVVFRWFGEGDFITGGTYSWPLDFFDSFERWRHLWYDIHGVAFPNPRNLVFLFPFQIIGALMQWLTGNSYLYQRLFFFVCLAVSGLSMYYLLLWLDVRTRARYIASFFYMFSPFALMVVWYQSIGLFFPLYAFFPLFLLLFLQVLAGRRTVAAVATILGVVPLSFGFANPALFFLFGAVSVAVGLGWILCARTRKERVRAFKSGLLLAGILAMMNFYWIAPFTTDIRGQFDIATNAQLNSLSDVFNYRLNTISILDALRTFGLWSFTTAPPDTADYYYPFHFVYRTAPFVLASFAVAVLIPLGFLYRPRIGKQVFLWRFMFLGFLLVTSGLLLPVAPLYEYILERVPFFVRAFRGGWSKFGVLYVTFFTVMIGFGLSWMEERRRHTVWLFLMPVALLAWPFFSGEVVFGGSVNHPGYRVRIPDSYLDTEIPAWTDMLDTKYLVLPLASTYTMLNAWPLGFSGTDVFPKIFRKQFYSHRADLLAVETIQLDRIETDVFVRLLQILGIGRVVIRDDALDRTGFVYAGEGGEEQLRPFLEPSYTNDLTRWYGVTSTLSFPLLYAADQAQITDAPLQELPYLIQSAIPEPRNLLVFGWQNSRADISAMMPYMDEYLTLTNRILLEDKSHAVSTPFLEYGVDATAAFTVESFGAQLDRRSQAKVGTRTYNLYKKLAESDVFLLNWNSVWQTLSISVPPLDPRISQVQGVTQPVASIPAGDNDVLLWDDKAYRLGDINRLYLPRPETHASIVQMNGEWRPLYHESLASALEAGRLADCSDGAAGEPDFVVDVQDRGEGNMLVLTSRNHHLCWSRDYRRFFPARRWYRLSLNYHIDQGEKAAAVITIHKDTGDIQTISRNLFPDGEDWGSVETFFFLDHPAKFITITLYAPSNGRPVTVSYDRLSIEMIQEKKRMSLTSFIPSPDNDVLVATGIVSSVVSSPEAGDPLPAPLLHESFEEDASVGAPQDCSVNTPGAPDIYAAIAPGGTDGDRALEVGSRNHHACWFRTYDIAPETLLYKFSFDYRIQAGENAGINYAIQFPNGSMQNFPTNLQGEIGVWRHYESFRQFPAGVNSVIVGFYAPSDGEETVVQYDNVRLEQFGPGGAKEYTLRSRADKRVGLPEALEYRRLRPTAYRVRLHRVKEPIFLVLSQSYHGGWQARTLPRREQSTPETLAPALADYRVLAGNTADQADPALLGDYIQRGWVSDLQSMPRAIDTFAHIDARIPKRRLEDYRVGFVSRERFGTIQNDNLPDISFFDAWRGVPVEDNNHFVANGYANGWWIDVPTLCEQGNICEKHADGSYDLDMLVQFAPQRRVLIFGAISAVSWLLCVGMVVVKRRKRA